MNSRKHIEENGLVFILTNLDSHIELDSSFEDIPAYYTQKNIYETIQRYENLFKKDVIFSCMNESICDGTKIIYKNFAWDLYKDIEAPTYVNNKYDFTYLCGIPRTDKLNMLSSLYMNNLLDSSLWSCGSLTHSSHKKISLPQLPKIIDYDKSIKGIHKQKCWRTINPEFYKYSKFSLVQETEMCSSSNRYTEKTYKCFYMKHPFIIAGNYQVLKLLRKDGFKTFHPFINEDYDTIISRDERIAAITKEVRRLINYTKPQWLKFKEKINHILEHNYRMAIANTNTSI